MSGILGPSPKFLALDNNGAPAAGYKLWTYAAGTATPKTTYTDYAATNPHTNPIILDSRGEATIYFSNSGGYKLALVSDLDVPIWSHDNYYGVDPSLYPLTGLTFAADSVILLTGAAAASVGKITDAYVATANKDGADGTASMRTLGYTSGKAAPGAGKDATGGFAGLTLFKINFKNALNTFTSFFTNANTAARTYTFQDRDGTIADNTDLALKAPIASPTFTGTVGGITATMVSLGNVDNTSDANKPVSSAQQSALNLKANDNAVPHLTGNENIGGIKTFTTAGGVIATGVTDGSSAAAGVVGEVITASLSYASGTALTTGTAKTIATLVLTAGAWDLSGAVHYNTSASTSQFLACVSSTTNAIPAFSTLGLPSSTGEYRAQLGLVPSTDYAQTTVPIPSYRLNLAAGATLYLVGYSSFTIGTVYAHGFLQARRVR